MSKTTIQPTSREVKALKVRIAELEKLLVNFIVAMEREPWQKGKTEQEVYHDALPLVHYHHGAEFDDLAKKCPICISRRERMP